MSALSPAAATEAPRARGLAAFAFVALLVHAPVLAALRPVAAHAEPASSAGAAAPTPAAARVERSAILRTAEADLLAKRVTLGETIIRLGWLDHAAQPPPLDPAQPAELALALSAYRAMLADVRSAMTRDVPVELAIVDAVARDGRAGRYKRMYPRLADALARGGGSCVALSTLAVTLAYDAGRGASASFRVYSNHVAPDVGGFHFGMAKRCHGPGEPLAASDLLTAYVRAPLLGGPDPFAFPHADEACDDPGDVFGDLQLVGDDPPPLPVTTSAMAPAAPEATATTAAAQAAAAQATQRAAAPEAECRRRTVLEEYEEDVEAIGEDGRSLGGVGVPRAATLDLKGHSASAACFERRADVATKAGGPDALVLALGDAAMAAEEAARVFATAGELDVAREYERKLAGHRTRAAAPLERVIAELNDPDADVSEILAGAGRLVALGEGGRTAMLLASERHRGFWELANMLTRSSSQLGAARRWGEKPIDVRLDVVDALPCASETFLAQLDTMAVPEARALRGACEVRARVDKESCVLDNALAHTRARGHTGTSAIDRGAGDLAEAVLVRHLSARCPGGAFSEAARRWAASKPEPIARALAGRLDARAR